MVKYRVVVNWNLCIADGVCYALCPQVFEVGPDGKAQIVEKFRGSNPWEGYVPEELKLCVEQASDACPSNAITIEKIE